MGIALIGCGLPLSAALCLPVLQVKDVSSYEPGQQLNVEEMFKAGDLVDLAGTTIGKGFQGELQIGGHTHAHMAQNSTGQQSQH